MSDEVRRPYRLIVDLDVPAHSTVMHPVRDAEQRQLGIHVMTMLAQADVHVTSISINRRVTL